MKAYSPREIVNQDVCIDEDNHPEKLFISTLSELWQNGRNETRSWKLREALWQR